MRILVELDNPKATKAPLANRIIQSLIYSNIWVSLAIGAITQCILLISNCNNNHFIVLNLSIGFLGYNYIYWIAYLTQPHKLHKLRRQWMKKNQLLILTLISSSAVIGALLFLQLPFKIKIGIFVCCSISFLYIIPSKRQAGLRWIPGFKLFLIAATWTVLTTHMPLWGYSLENYFLIIIAVFFLIIGLTIPFDIRDFNSDHTQLKTVPLLFGINRAVRLSQLCILSFGIIISFSTPIINIIPTSLFTLSSIILINRTKLDRSQNYINFIIEGLPIIWLILLYFTNFFLN